MLIRDRIKELRRVPAASLRPNPRNWRTHPPAQRDALQGILSEIGYADALVARELPDGSLELIDGHLRAETTPDALVPVLVLDVDEAEAAKLLATLDPISSLAGRNEELLGSLMDDVRTDNAALETLWKDLRRTYDDLPTPTAIEEPKASECYQLVVECDDEADQRELYERLIAEGRKCRVLTL